MASTWVYLIRHGEVEHAGEGRFFGHADVPLSRVGREQAEALARTLGSEAIEAVYASGASPDTDESRDRTTPAHAVPWASSPSGSARGLPDTTSSSATTAGSRLG